MSLSKGATFHISSSLPAEDDPVLSIRHLARRSPTGSHTTLLSLISEDQNTALKSIQDFEQTFSGARGKRQTAHRRSTVSQLQIRPPTSPSDEGLGSSISPSSEKGLAVTFDRILDLVDKDSGLGSSVHPSEEDGLVKDLIQGWLARSLMMYLNDVDHNLTDTDHPDSTAPRTRLRRGQGSQAPLTTNVSAVTQSIAPQSHTHPRPQPRLSKFARRKISQHIVDPILREEKFRIFHPLVASLGSKSNKAVRCLRDVEQSLIFQPFQSLVSQLLNFSPHHHRPATYLFQTPAVSGSLYRTFGEFSIQLVVDTYPHLSENEQRRIADRPYDNGYFLDLVQQVGQLAARISRARTRSEGESTGNDEMDYSPDDEVTMEGGLADTGNMAELVRWKNGKGTSLRTGLPYEPTPGMKRQHTTEELDEDAARSMARRKKGAEYRAPELKCSDRDCDKAFSRKCDLAKHEKTHTRPFKCPHAGCKYHELGLPTEKERDRHINDKHETNPQYYKCDFCEFKTKRQSNCKQHMEKKHGWTYERVKGNGKTNKATPNATPKTPSIDYSYGDQSPEPSHMWDDASSIAGSIMGSANITPYEQPLNGFPNFNHPVPSSTYPLFSNQTTFVHTQPGFGFEVQATGQMYPPASPAQTYGYGAVPSGNTQRNFMRTPETPTYSAISPSESTMHNLHLTMDYQPVENFDRTGLPTPNSGYAPFHSRHSSLYESPSQQGPRLQSLAAQRTALSASADENAVVSHSQLPREDDFTYADFQLTDPSFDHSRFGPTDTLFPEIIAAEQYITSEDDTMLDMDNMDTYINYNPPN